MSYNQAWSSMGKLKRLQIKETLSYIHPSDSETKLVNCLKMHSNISDEHMDKVYEICKWLKKHGKDFLTEARFKTGGRADIIVLEDCVAIEVLVTETVDSFLKNKSKYPIKTIAVPYNTEWRGI